MSPKKVAPKAKIRSIADVERRLAAQIRGEKLHGRKLTRVPKLHRKKYYEAADKKMKKMRAAEEKLKKQLAENKKKMETEAAKVLFAIRHDHEIINGFVTKKQMQDFRAGK